MSPNSASPTLARLQAKLKAKNGNGNVSASQDEGRIKVLDLTMYNGEPIMELRLKYLYPYVDEFIVVESRETHSGIMKQFLYLEKHADIFKPYADKVTKIVIDKFPEEFPYVVPGGPDKEAWKRENYGRDYAYNEYIKETYKDQKYVIVCCDCDEIPRAELVQNSGQFHSMSVPIFLDMKMLKYNFRWTRPEVHWTHPFIISDSVASTIELSRVRVGIQRQAIMPRAGWHLTYFLTVGDNVRKLESFAHSEFNKDTLKNREYIKMCMLTGRFHLSGDGKDRLHPYVDTADLPDGWAEFQMKLDEMVYQEEVEYQSKNQETWKA